MERDPIYDAIDLDDDGHHCSLLSVYRDTPEWAAAFAFPEIRTEARSDVARSADRDAVRLNA